MMIGVLRQSHHYAEKVHLKVSAGLLLFRQVGPDVEGIPWASCLPESHKEPGNNIEVPLASCPTLRTSDPSLNNH